MNLDAALAQLRPVLSIAGSIIIAVGLLKFFGLEIGLTKSGLELAVAGWLLKAI